MDEFTSPSDLCPKGCVYLFSTAYLNRYLVSVECLLSYMLNHLKIVDFALIEQLELDFDTGLSALTGETGAGKSILLGAIGLILGDRADSDRIRAGAERSEVVALFDISDRPQLQRWLEAQEMESEECVIRRTLSRSGRGRCYLNDRPVTLQTLRELGSMLIDVHGQHAHQSLTDAAEQRTLLDGYAGHRELVSRVKNAAEAWRRSAAALERLCGDERERTERADLLRFQSEELDQLALQPGEPEQLDQEQRRLAHAEHLIQTTRGVQERLFDSDSDSVVDLLRRAISELRALLEHDTDLTGVLELFEQAELQLEEGHRELRGYMSGLELDPRQLTAIEERLAEVHRLARKHRVEPEQLPELAARLTQERAELSGSDEKIAQLSRQLEIELAAYNSLAEELSHSRRSYADALGEEVTTLIQSLGMAAGRFEVSLEVDPEGEPQSNGRDRIEFRVSANPGHPLRPLSRVASGGELSRIALAIRTSTAGRGGIPTMIFDEVDTGIGGSVAERVGRLLQTLGQQHQVLCVTHLPQVAAQAHNHFLIHKETLNGTTETTVQRLHHDDRLKEISRMLGGIEITEQTRAHAAEILLRGEGKK